VVLNHGHFEYILDDAYIHLSMARNLLSSGTYGVVAGSYESASSSPAWTLLLAFVGSLFPLALVILPLLFNVFASAALLWVFWSGQDLVRPERGGPIVVLALAALLPLFLLLPSLSLAGMEAVLQALLALLILRTLLKVVAGDVDRATVVGFLSLVAISVLVRLEDLFLATGCGLAILLFGRGRLGQVVDRLRLAGGVAVAAALPAAGIAIVNLGFGQSWLPNSVISKSALFERSGLPLVPLGEVWYRLQGDPLLCLLLVVSFVYLVRCAIFNRAAATLPVAVAYAVTALLHLALATVGWYDRYQEYLVVMGTWLLFRYASELAPERRKVAAAAVVLLLLVAGSPRKAILTIFTPTASNNIYLQQHQMGVFLGRYYDRRAAVINDLGEVSHRHRGPLLDMFGLGSYQVLQARRAHRFDAAFVDSRTRAMGAPVAVIYSDYWKPQVPSTWKLVGSWTVSHAPGNLGGARVDFWATSAGATGELRSDLEAYGRELPEGVTARFY